MEIGGGIYAIGGACGQIYYYKYGVNQYQKDKWICRNAALSVFNVSGAIFMLGFENKYYSMTTGK